MKKNENLLTESAVNTATTNPEGKPKKHSDGGGLYLLVNRAGKYWRYDYRYSGKRKTFSIGTWPEVTLEEARAEHDAARQKLLEGIDPSQNKQLKKLIGAVDNSFESTAVEWYGRNLPDWSDSHSKRVLAYLRNDVFPFIGSMPVDQIRTVELVPIIDRIANRGAKESARRVAQVIKKIFSYAKASGRTDQNPALDLSEVLPKHRPGHFAAITDPQAVGALLTDIEGYRGSFIVRNALKLSALTLLRPGELRNAQWSEFDFEQGLWIIPVRRMKAATHVKRQDLEVHLVPLSRQALAILNELLPVSGNGEYVFPGNRYRQRPMSENTVNVALRRMGYTNDQMTAHGFRAMGSTLLNEMKRPDGSRLFSVDAIERQLSHKHKDPVRGAYDRSGQLAERIEMMQVWADHLDQLKAAHNATQIQSFPAAFASSRRT